MLSEEETPALYLLGNLGGGKRSIFTLDASPRLSACFRVEVSVLREDPSHRGDRTNMQYVTCITSITPAHRDRCGNPECTTRDKIPPHGPEPSSLQRSRQENFHRGWRSCRKSKTLNVPQWSQDSLTVPSGSFSSTSFPRESIEYLPSRQLKGLPGR